jgi:hypothetical protein
MKPATSRTSSDAKENQQHPILPSSFGRVLFKKKKIQFMSYGELNSMEYMLVYEGTVRYVMRLSSGRQNAYPAAEAVRCRNRNGCSRV